MVEKNIVKVRNYTNACVTIQSPNELLVVDPWLSDGKYLGTWHNFPRVSEPEKKDISKANVCFITHIHPDHYDIDFLKKMPKSTQFVIPKVWGWPVIMSGLKKNGFENITVLECAEEVFETSDFHVKAVPPLNTSGLDYDSSNLDEMAIDGGFVFIHKKSKLKLVFLADDNLYSHERVSIFSDLMCNADLIACAYNGFASDFPFQYDFSFSQKVKIIEENEKKRFNKQVQNLKLLKPKFFLPYSSEYVAVGKHSDKWFQIFPHIWTSDKDLVAKKYSESLNIEADTLYPGEILEFENNERKPITKTYDRKSIYEKMKVYREEVENFENKVKSSKASLKKINEIKYLFKKASESLINAKKKHKISPKQNIVVMVDNNFVGEVTSDNIINQEKKTENQAYLCVNGSSDIITSLLKNEIHWNNALLSMRLQWSRSPNFFCENTFHALNYLRS